MAANKLYIGRKVRDLRQANRATQAQFAERLGISVSYLNQIENNQRPVSAGVLVALAEKFRIDLAELSGGEGDRLVSALSETLTDTLFDGYTPSLQELKLVTQNAPGFAHALIAAHRAYRHNSEQLASINDTLGRSLAAVEATPYEEVRDFFHFVDNYIGDLDQLAEALAAEIGIGDTDPGPVLSGYLERQYGVRIARATQNDDLVRAYDPQARLLTLNSYLPAPTRHFQIALQIAQLHSETVVNSVAAGAGFRTTEAYEICRIGPAQLFRRRAAAALSPLPGRRQGDAPRPRLARPHFRREPRTGLPPPLDPAAAWPKGRSDLFCPHRPGGQHHQAPQRNPPAIRPLRRGLSAVECTPGLRKPRPHHPPARRNAGWRALSLSVHAGLARRARIPPAAAAVCAGTGLRGLLAENFVYADDMDLTNAGAYDPIGISCRICERTQCASRAVPPLKGRLVIEHNIRRTIPYSIRPMGDAPQS
jgi:transcriptional regulator with XRE-family HTH domain